MRAVILAAGRGTRLEQGRRPKCLARVGGRHLIDYQLAALWYAGVESVTMVIGYEQAQVREAVTSADFVVNEDYATTNSLSSFLLAREAVGDEEELLVLNADVLFHPYVLNVLDATGDNALVYDSRSGHDAEEMKVAVQRGRLIEMSKNLPRRRTQGENLGILRLGPDAAREAFAAAEDLIGRGRHQDWIGSAINLTAWRHPFHCFDAAGFPWVEIDFPDDLERARTHVLPSIHASLWRRPSPRGAPLVASSFDPRTAPREDQETGRVRWLFDNVADRRPEALEPRSSVAARR